MKILSFLERKNNIKMNKNSVYKENNSISKRNIYNQKYCYKIIKKYDEKIFLLI